MRTQIDYILAERLARLAGRLGRHATRFVGLRLPVNQATHTLTVRADVERVLSVLQSVLAEAGEIVPWPAGSVEGRTIGAIVGSGQGGLNPALILGTIQTTSDGNTDITLAGYAKEGLVKQRGGEEASRRVMNLLQAYLGQSELEFVVPAGAPPN